MAASERPWIVIDHELLSRLDAFSTRDEWERTLRRTGLHAIELPGQEGKDLRDVRRALVGWREAGAPAALPVARPAAVVAALGACALLYAEALWPAIGVGGLAVGLWLGWRPSSPRVDRFPEQATRALRRLLSRTFVESGGGTIVENTPHRMYLELRLAEVEGTLRVADGRAEDLRGLQERIALSNTALGRDPADVETQRIGTALVEIEQGRERVRAVGDLLRQRLVRLDDQLAKLRLHVERRALSERLSLLTEGDALEPVERIMADIEVDVAELEALVSGPALDATQSNARLQALLEVVHAEGGSRG